MLYFTCFQNTRSHYDVLYLFSEHQIPLWCTVFVFRTPDPIMLYCTCFQNTRSHYAVLYLFSEHQIVGQNIVPSNTKYLGEVRISSEENLAIFPCEMLAEISGQNVLEVCFRYVTSSIVGTTYSPVSLCLPATMKGKDIDAQKFEIQGGGSLGFWPNSFKRGCQKI
jgi:hypothetical protein